MGRKNQYFAICEVPDVLVYKIRVFGIVILSLNLSFLVCAGCRNPYFILI